MFHPNLLLGPIGMATDADAVPCVMARGANTHEVMKIWDVRSGQQYDRPPIEAAEVMMGYQPGVSYAFGASQVPIALREIMVGNAFHASFLQSILRDWVPAEHNQRVANVMSMRVDQYATPLEIKLRAMDDEELEQWMLKRLVILI